MSVLLRQIDLSKSQLLKRSDPDWYHKHPDIKAGRIFYLVKWDGRYYAGRFSEQWYGLNFQGWVNPAGLQYDAPGANHSLWQEVWEIVEKK